MVDGHDDDEPVGSQKKIQNLSHECRPYYYYWTLKVNQD